ncbi:hypothetical protein BB561_004093 [Smittium simulii]|uniref:Uncharacterized protein n=1 Tax=Smittium simulii TaxID=133385 RepID=A0A2T9YHX5_9FUNG|nr:hypothetical protein BB561_004093 [Smittium simulii]
MERKQHSAQQTQAMGVQDSELFSYFEGPSHVVNQLGCNFGDQFWLVNLRENRRFFQSCFLSSSFVSGKTNAVVLRQPCRIRRCVGGGNLDVYGRGHLPAERCQRAAWARLTDNKWVNNIVKKVFQIPFRNLNPKKPKALIRENFIISREIIAKQLIPENVNIFSEEKKKMISYGPPLTLHPHQYKRKMSKEASDAITKESTLYNTKKDRRPTSSSRSPETQQLCQREEFQNGIPDIHMQDNKEKRLYDLSGSRGRFYAHSDTPEVQEISLFLMEREDLLILCSSASKGKMYREYKKLYSKISQLEYKIKMEKSNMTPFQFITHLGIIINSRTMSLKVPSDKKLDKLYWKSTKFFGCFPPWSSNAEEAFGIEKQFFEKSEIMDCHELRILETESAKMERSIVSTRDSRNGNLYQCQQYGMGNSCWIPVLFRIVTSINSISPNKRQKIISSVLCSTTPQFCLSLCLSLFRQHYNSSIRAKFWGNYLSKITRSFRKAVISLYNDKHTSEYDLCTNVYQPCRRTIKTDRSNNKNYPNITLLLLSPVESNTTDPTESSTGKDNYDKNYANLKVCDLVSNSGKIQNSRTHTNTGVGDNPDPKIGKFPLLNNKSWLLMAWIISGAPFSKKALQTLF